MHTANIKLNYLVADEVDKFQNGCVIEAVAFITNSEYANVVTTAEKMFNYVKHQPIAVVDGINLLWEVSKQKPIIKKGSNAVKNLQNKKALIFVDNHAIGLKNGKFLNGWNYRNSQAKIICEIL